LFWASKSWLSCSFALFFIDWNGRYLFDDRPLFLLLRARRAHMQLVRRHELAGFFKIDWLGIRAVNRAPSLFLPERLLEIARKILSILLVASQILLKSQPRVARNRAVRMGCESTIICHDVSVTSSSVLDVMNWALAILSTRKPRWIRAPIYRSCHAARPIERIGHDRIVDREPTVVIVNVWISSCVVLVVSETVLIASQTRWDFILSPYRLMRTDILWTEHYLTMINDISEIILRLWWLSHN